MGIREKFKLMRRDYRDYSYFEHMWRAHYGDEPETLGYRLTEDYELVPMSRMERLRAFFDRRSPILLKYVVYEVATWFRERHCRKHGHDFVDHGYCGPDSGAIDLTCKRCGISYHHSLY